MSSFGRGSTSSGSGFIVSRERGLVLTNKHVVRGCAAVKVRIAGGESRVATVRALDQDDEGVTATLRDLDSGDERTVRARYVVAADGNRSPTRARLGIPTSRGAPPVGAEQRIGDRPLGPGPFRAHQPLLLAPPAAALYTSRWTGG